MKKFLLIMGTILGIAACDSTRTVYVDRPVQLPGKVDTTIIIRPETTIVQRPGRVDTIVVTTHTPPETLYVKQPPKVDTVIKTLTDTLLVATHDTVIFHDTVVHVDTVLLRLKEFLCIYTEVADSALIGTGPECDPAKLATFPLFKNKALVPRQTLAMTVGQKMQLEAVYWTATERVSSKSPSFWSSFMTRFLSRK